MHHRSCVKSDCLFHRDGFDPAYQPLHLLSNCLIAGNEDGWNAEFASNCGG
jgi:hypothetical protein